MHFVSCFLDFKGIEKSGFIANMLFLLFFGSKEENIFGKFL